MYTNIHSLKPIYLKISKIVATFSIWIILVKLRVNMRRFMKTQDDMRGDRTIRRKTIRRIVN